MKGDYAASLFTAMSGYSHALLGKTTLAQGALSDISRGYKLSALEIGDALEAAEHLTHVGHSLGEFSRLGDTGLLERTFIEIESISIGRHKAAIEAALAALKESERERRLFKSVEMFWAGIKVLSPGVRQALQKSRESNRRENHGVEMAFYEPGTIFALLFTKGLSEKLPRAESMDEWIAMSSGFASFYFMLAELVARSSGAGWRVRRHENQPESLDLVLVCN